MISTSPSPGWYRDPTSSSPQLRYWDGQAWGTECRAYGPPIQGSSDESKHKVSGRRTSRFGSIKWGAVTFIVIGIAVIGLALLKGQPVKDVDLASGKVSFYSSGDPEAIEQVQAEAQSEVSNLKEEAREQAAAQPEFNGPDLSGAWSPVGGAGQWYEIGQFGDQIVIQELTPWGITATGSGTVTDGLVSFSFTAYNGTAGFGELRFDGSSALQGTLTSSAYGSTPVQWNRSSP